MFSFLKKEQQLSTQQKGLSLKSHELAQALTHAPRNLSIQIESVNEQGETVLSEIESVRIIEDTLIIKEAYYLGRKRGHTEMAMQTQDRFSDITGHHSEE